MSTSGGERIAGFVFSMTAEAGHVFVDMEVDDIVMVMPAGGDDESFDSVYLKGLSGSTIACDLPLWPATARPREAITLAVVAVCAISVDDI
jgi:hypothetical protein